MNRQPVHWRARWALAQITGVLFSSVVWLVVLATSNALAAGALLAGAVFMLAFRTRPALWLAFGARPAAPVDRDVVLRAIVPIPSLRGRNQPRVFVARGRRARGWDVVATDRRTLLVSESMLARIKRGEASDLEVSASVARAFGEVPVFGSRVVLVVDLYCLPWTILQQFTAGFASGLSKVPLMSLSWRLRPIVFGLGLLDAVQHQRWEAAIPLAVLTVLTYTTTPLRRAWQRRLTEMGNRRVADEGLVEGLPSGLGRLGGTRSAEHLETSR